MAESIIIPSLGVGTILLLWLRIVRSQRSRGRPTVRLAIFAHIAGTVIWLPMLAMVVIIESLGSDAMAGWTWRRSFAAVWFWLMMSFVVAAALLTNAKRGRRGLFGSLGKNVL